ncbi:phosphatidate cytidylyltransferase [Undibacter mobilis]|uniref:Phosphatidate cytidylyltransferase n=1 Tax=Undibacter mobilis TaxID=2292256 RepID=A0A371B118_9BRAD|nr:phosphatidate cytidylyltransferase [Undibacter mobilis]RDV01240.1 phosphatidate cytidylyltransferase [Undibacter mobilis]
MSVPPAEAGVNSGDGKPATSNLVLRVISAAVMAPVAIGAAWWGGWIFAVFWVLAALAVLWEWIGLVAGRDHRMLVLSCGGAIVLAAILAWTDHPVAALLLMALGALAASIFVTRAQRLWIVGGIGYAGSMMLAPMILRGEDVMGFIAIVLLFAVVWTTDVLAYFTGRAIGGPKLMPAVSPKKTWSGAIGGTIGAVAAAVAVATLFGGFNTAAIAGLAVVLSVVSQAGDLLESHIKRHFNAKDASQLIPGHGGAMDRLDGFWAAAIVAVAIGIVRGGLDEPARGLLIW